METSFWIQCIIFVVGCELVGAIGIPFTMKSIPTWYAALRKPSFNPPNWIFGPVWTFLYLLIGICGSLLWRDRTLTHGHLALAFFFIQLALNALWTPLFFGAHQLKLAFVEIIIMLTSIVLTIVFSCMVSVWAGILLIPYAIWVSFASILNYKLLTLNK